VKPEYWIGLAALLAVAVVLFSIVLLWLRRRRRSLSRALKDVSIDRLHNVLLPDGMGGQIQVEHLLLTASGLVVVDVKEFQGKIFAGERMAEWTVIGQHGRFTFPNPLPTLYDRVAALKQIVRDVPVFGLVLFGAGADFTKGRPTDVVLPGDLVERCQKPEPDDLERLLVAFTPHWERVKAAIEPVTSGARTSAR